MTHPSTPGLNFRWPYPIEVVELPKVTRVNRIEELGHAPTQSELLLARQAALATGQRELFNRRDLGLRMRRREGFAEGPCHGKCSRAALREA